MNGLHVSCTAIMRSVVEQTTFDSRKSQHDPLQAFKQHALPEQGVNKAAVKENKFCACQQTRSLGFR